MYILLIFYFVFLLAYIAFNTYAVFRVNTMRIKGDVTGLALAVYIIAIILIILISLILLSRLSWTQKIGGLL